MFRVPGSTSSLEKEKAAGRSIQVVYSSMESIKISQKNSNKKNLFLGVGFETTAPSIAATIKMADDLKIENFFILSGHKLIPPAMKALIDTEELKLDGFICPGHVSTVIGSRPYDFIAEEYGIPCVITGFEPVDVMEAIYILTDCLVEGKSPAVTIQYRRSVRRDGNPKAIETMYDVFEVCDSEWRGIGYIPGSGLKVKERYGRFNIEDQIEVQVEETRQQKGCICGEILRGLKTPLDCRLFKVTCTPQNPLGACMVSSEGTCAAYYKYGG
jgi:hydrogenase expression/formation protein HypD